MTPKSEITSVVIALARKVWQETCNMDNPQETATRVFKELMMREPQRRQMVSYLMERGIQEIMRNVVSDMRSVIERGNQTRIEVVALNEGKTRKLSDEEITAAMERSVRRYGKFVEATEYLWQLPQTHKPIGDATRGEILVAKDYYNKLRDTYARRCHVLSAVADLMPDDVKTVRECITLAQLAAIMSPLQQELAHEQANEEQRRSPPTPDADRQTS